MTSSSPVKFFLSAALSLCFLTNRMASAHSYDPSWTRQFGTTGNETDIQVAVDASGNIVVAGTSNGAFTGLTQNWGPREDAFVARFDGAGNKLWVKQFGNVRVGNLGVAVDNDGNTFVAGSLSNAVPTPEPSSAPTVSPEPTIVPTSQVSCLDACSLWKHYR